MARNLIGWPILMLVLGFTMIPSTNQMAQNPDHHLNVGIRLNMKQTSLAESVGLKFELANNLIRVSSSSLLSDDSKKKRKATCIDFDKLVTGAAIPEETLIAAQYQSLGVDFSSDDPDWLGLKTLASFAVSQPNVVYAGNELGNTMIATFRDPATNAPAVTNFVSIAVDNDTFGKTEKLYGVDLGQNIVAVADVNYSMPGNVVNISTSVPAIHQVILVTSDYFDDFCFGEVHGTRANIQGTKWNDLNGNGQQDTGEPGLPGVTIQVKNVNGNVIASAVTGPSGEYLIDVPAATYTVSEVQQPGWTQTFPTGSGTHAVTIPPSTMNINFGNKRTTCVPPPSGVVAWWPLDEPTGSNRFSDIVSKNDGTPTGGGPTSVVGDYVGNSLQFGEGNYVGVQDHPSINFGVGDFSIDAWVKFTPENQIEPIVYKADAKGGYFLHIFTPEGGPSSLVLRIGSLTFFGPEIPAPTGTWIFVAAARSGSTVTLYVDTPTNSSLDSPVVATILPPHPSASSSTPLLIGGWTGSPYANLAIDELELFNRGLVMAEIEELFDTGTVGKCRT